MHKLRPKASFSKSLSSDVSQPLAEPLSFSTPVFGLGPGGGTIPAFAFGLRRLVYPYLGYAIRVRRDADDFEVDVKFDDHPKTSSGKVSLESTVVDGGTELTGSVTGGTYTGSMTLKAFAGSDTVYVVKWYDQSGNGRDAYQYTEAAQPILIASGTLEADGIDFVPNDYLVADYKFTTTNDHTFHAVAKTDDSGVYAIMGDIDSYNDGAELLTLSGAWSYRIDNTDLEPAATTTNKAHLLASYETGLSSSEQQLRVNGTLAQQNCTETLAFGTSNRIRIGARLDTDNALNGKISEVVAWDSKLTTVQQDIIVNDTMTYHSLPKPSHSAVSVLFDDVDDWISSGSADNTLAIKTYSFWAKTTATAANPIFDHGATARGAFYFTHNTQRPLLYMAGSNFRYWVANSDTYDGDWHHHLLVINTTITDAKYYVDGVAQTASTTNSAGAQNSYTQPIRIGRGASSFYAGSLDEFGVFDGDQSLYASTFYNNGNPATLIKYAKDNWWRMGDGDSGVTLTDYGSGGNNATLQAGTQLQFDSPSY